MFNTYAKEDGRQNGGGRTKNLDQSSRGGKAPWRRPPMASSGAPDPADSSNSAASPSTVDEWIRDRFAKRECVRVVPISKDSSKCYCGRHLALHYYFEGEEDSGESEECGCQKWTIERCTALYPTDAHGTLTFRVGKGSRKARYLRSDFDTDPSDLYRLLVSVWGLEPPTLIISVLDNGEHHHSLSPHFVKAFKKGLAKAARTASTWIITSGLKTGITELVTAAFHETSATRNNKPKQAHVIGFAPWGRVRGNDQLLVGGVNGMDVIYSGHSNHHNHHSNEHRRSGGFSHHALADGHSGFVLVDDGTMGGSADQSSGRTESARRLFENYLRNLPMRGKVGGRCVPMVCLMVNGRVPACEAFMDYLSNEPFAPVVVCAGTGGAADWIANHYEKSGRIADGSSTKEPPTHRRFVRQLQAALGTERNETITLANALRDAVLSRRELITTYRVFDSDRSASPDSGIETRTEENDLDVAMLNALLKGQPLSSMEKLNLTVTWDREDLAREILDETGGIVGLDWPNASLDEAMLNALMYDRVDFVNLLLSNGIAMDRFLTIARLEQLYNSDCGPPNTLRFILRDVVKNVNENSRYKLSHIGLIVEKLMGFGYRSTYCRREFRRRYKIELANPRRKSTNPHGDQSHRRSTVAVVEDSFTQQSPRRASIFLPYRNRPHFAYPYHELFIWAVLTNRKQLAVCFWQNGQEQLAKALMGSRLYESLAKEAEEDYLEMDVCQQLEKNAKEFSTLACELLAQCYETDDDLTLQLLTYELRQFSKSTCISLAANCSNEPFVAHRSCQLLLADLWLGGLRLRKNINVKVLAGILCPPVIAYLTFKSQEELQLQAQTAEESQNYRIFEEDRRKSWQDDNSSVSSSESESELEQESERDVEAMTIAEEELSVHGLPSPQPPAPSVRGTRQLHAMNTEFSVLPSQAMSVRFSPSIDRKRKAGEDPADDPNQRKISQHSILDEGIAGIPLERMSEPRDLDHSQDTPRKVPKPFRRFATAFDLNPSRLHHTTALNSAAMDRPPVAPNRPKQRQQLKIGRKILEFYSAPVTSFWSYTIGYMIFLSFFTYIVLVRTPIIPDWPEYYVIAFFATYSTDQIRKILVQEPRRLSAKLKVFFSCIWDCCATFACAFFFLALFLRLDPETLAPGRILYCINIVFWYLRVLRLLSVNSQLGPYINMYGKMVAQLFLLSTILFVLLASFGILRQSIVVPDQDWQWSMLRNITYKPYSMLYGSLYPEEIALCEDDGTNCTTGYWLTPIFMTIYLLLAIVVFMNMMVAAFSHIFNQINDRAQEIAKYDAYRHVMEFEQQPFWPPPLIVISHIYMIGKFLYKRFCQKQRNYHFEHSLKLFLAPDEKEKLHEFERDCLTELLAKKAEKQANTLDSRLLYFSERLDAMTSQVDYLYDQDQSHRMGLLKLDMLFASTTGVVRSNSSLVPSMSSGGLPPPSPLRSISDIEGATRKSEASLGSGGGSETIVAHLVDAHPARVRSNARRPLSWSKEKSSSPRRTPPKEPRARLLSEHQGEHGFELGSFRSRSGSAPSTPTGRRAAVGAEFSRSQSPRKLGRVSLASDGFL